MTRHVVRLAVPVFALLGVAACSSGRRLPPGTPAPEYEPPVVTPWPAPQADAGTPVNAPTAASVAPESAAGAELSPDASVR
ncbi:MAG: hypothetical protein ABI548_03325 [Polyangiaceae bacterium]